MQVVIKQAAPGLQPPKNPISEDWVYGWLQE